MLFKILTFIFIAGAIYFGVRRILVDWKNQFKSQDAAKKARDLNESKRPDVVELKRDKDGIFRPGKKEDT